MNVIKDTQSITIEFTDNEFKILADALLDPLDWIEQAVINKLANRKTALVSEWANKFLTDKSIESIPTDDALLLEMIFNHPDYKNRQEREQPLGQKSK